MSLLSYQLSVKKYQKELGLDARTFNALDVKYNDVDLLKQLQILNPVIAAPAVAPASSPAPANTGFYGILTIANEKQAGTPTVPLKARLYYNSTPLTNEITVGYPDTENLEVVIADRLPNPSSTLVLRIKYAEGYGITSVDLNGYYGFTPAGLTNNPLTENNYLDMVVDSGEIDGGALTIELVSTAPE
jgi:hypothetical protein